MRAIDVSQWQGDINWAAVQAPIAIMKVSGGDAGLYYDSKATRNYGGAKAAGKGIGMYHFAGGGNATEEADFFIRAASPLEKNDVLVLDWEIQHPDPVGWCVTFIQRVIDKTGVRPLIYMNSNTATTINWQRVVDMNVGLWVAHYGLSTNDNVPVGSFKTYVMHQYTSSGSEPGVAGRVDVNEWFGTVEQFNKYGYQGAPIQDVTPAPAPEPTPSVPDPVPIVTPTPDPVVDPTPEPTIPETPASTAINYKAILVRSINTFLITFVTVAGTGLAGVTDLPTLKVLGLSALAAAVAAVKNVIIKPQEAK